MAAFPTVTVTLDAAGGALAVGTTMAGALALGAAADATSAAREAMAALTASAGALGPILTPAIFGQATPIAKPTSATTPTRSHEGLSASGAGICTEGRAAMRAIVSMLPF
jgi:hypothetical protein